MATRHSARIDRLGCRLYTRQIPRLESASDVDVSALVKKADLLHSPVTGLRLPERCLIDIFVNHLRRPLDFANYSQARLGWQFFTSSIHNSQD